MGKLSDKVLTVLEIAVRDALAGRRVLITAGSSKVIDELFRHLRFDPIGDDLVLNWSNMVASTERGGYVRFAPVRNFRDLERFRGLEIEEIVSLGVQHRFVDLLREFATGRRAVFTLAGQGE